MESLNNIFTKIHYRQKCSSTLHLYDIIQSRDLYKLIKWCNHINSSNPIIFISTQNRLTCYHIISSILKILPSISSSSNRAISRKMQKRYIQTGFPITLKIYCISCTNYVVITSRYIHSLYIYLSNQTIHKILYCDCCKNRFYKKSINTIDIDTTDEYSDICKQIENISIMSTNTSNMYVD